MIYSEIDKVILDVEKLTREKDREQQRLLMLRRRKMQQKDYLEQLSVNNPEEKLPKGDQTSGNSNKSTTVDSAECHVEEAQAKKPP